jgi:hypothetical protein
MSNTETTVTVGGATYDTTVATAVAAESTIEAMRGRLETVGEGIPMMDSNGLWIWKENGRQGFAEQVK